MNIISNQNNWYSIARPNQRMPSGDWFLWLILAGRGFGKTRTGAETVMELTESGKYKNIAIIGKNLNEARKIMIEGPSGILSTSFAFPEKIKYFPSKRQLVWENNAHAVIFGADNYDSLRGYQFDLVWIDEFAKFKSPKNLWDQVLFTLRIGDNPKCIMTTTPKPIKILRDLVDAPFTHLTRGTTFENKNNLAAKFIETMTITYQNTQLGKQELMGEILANRDNYLWKPENIIYKDVSIESLKRVVVGIDPAVTSSETSDETGIIVAGLGNDEKIYVIDDLSGKYKPIEWAKIAARAYTDFGASRVVAEVNNGGDLVEGMLRNISQHIPYSSVRAIRGKISRAEPVALLYEALNVFHIKPFHQLEQQMCALSYDETEKNQQDDRVDALVWAISELTLKTQYSAKPKIDILC